MECRRPLIENLKCHRTRATAAAYRVTQWIQNFVDVQTISMMSSSRTFSLSHFFSLMVILFYFKLSPHITHICPLRSLLAAHSFSMDLERGEKKWKERRGYNTHTHRERDSPPYLVLPFWLGRKDETFFCLLINCLAHVTRYIPQLVAHPLDGI